MSNIMKLNRQKIKLEMERLGWSESELARRMGRTRQQVNRILYNGDLGISLKLVTLFADTLGIDPKDLLTS